MAIDYKPEQNDYTNLTPFKTWLVNQINSWGVNNFPFLEGDFDKLTNYGMLMKMMKCLNDLINNQNLVEEDMSNLFNAFTELQNYINDYFDNLDVQEEINNKLDSMAQDGSLTNLIKNYVDPIYQAYETSINNRVDNFESSITASVNSLDVKVNRATSGTPLVASSTAGMTDTSRIYVNTSDGNWYYYNGSSWVSGGTYQSTGIDTNLENQIYTNKENIDFITENNNYLEFNNILLGKYYDDNHQEVVNATFNCAIINCEKLSYVKVTNNTTGAIHVRYYNNGTLTRYLRLNSGTSFGLDLTTSDELTIAYNKDEMADVLVQNRYNFIDEKRKLLPSNDVNVTIYENAYIDDNFNIIAYNGVNTYLYNMEYYSKVIYSNRSETSSDVRTFTSDRTLISKDNAYYQSWCYDNDGNIGYVACPVRTTIDSSNYDVIGVPKFDVYYNRIFNTIESGLSGKKISFIGDSITYGYNGADPGTRVNKPYPEIIHDKYGATSTNLGINGSTLSTVDNGVHNPICNRVNTIPTDSDIIVVFAGTNDYAFGTEIGTFDSNDNATIYGSLKTIVNHFYTNLLNKKLYICTPLKRSVMGANGLGYTLEDYANAIKDACKKYSVQCIDLFNEGYSYPSNSNFLTNNLPDGLHPSQDYYYLIADVISKKI